MNLGDIMFLLGVENGKAGRPDLLDPFDTSSATTEWRKGYAVGLDQRKRAFEEAYAADLHSESIAGTQR